MAPAVTGEQRRTRAGEPATRFPPGELFRTRAPGHDVERDRTFAIVPKRQRAGSREVLALIELEDS